jgi:ATP-dependent HslUV protease ATP-binding subunit HslU
LPELQGRLPIRVELRALVEKDFVRILTEPEANLIKQYTALMATEDLSLSFTSAAIQELAKLAAEINSVVENIGARRLHTVMEKLLEEISFTATDRAGESVEITAEMVQERVGELVTGGDLSKFIL